jgi:hypothetical protein
MAALPSGLTIFVYRPDGELSSSNHDHVQDQQRMTRQKQDAKESNARSENGVAFSTCQELRLPRNPWKAVAGDEEAAAGLGRAVLGKS